MWNIGGCGAAFRGEIGRGIIRATHGWEWGSNGERETSPLFRIFKAVVFSLAILTALALGVSAAHHEAWVEARSPNFIVVSNAGEREARKIAIQFEEIRVVFQRSLAIASAHTTPTVTIIAVNDEDSMRALLPEFWARGHTHPAGIASDNMGQFFVAMQLDEPGESPYKTIYHEYFHSLTRPYYPHLPVWVAEGLAEFYGSTRITDSGTIVGEPDPLNISELRKGGFIPLDVLFKVDQSSPYYNEQNKTTIFYAESWALAHYLMVGDKTAHRPMLIAYLDALSHGATEEQAAAKAFGDLKNLQAALFRYIDGYSFYSIKQPAAPEPPASDLATRKLSDAEVEAYRGGFAAVRGRSKEAIPILKEAVKLDPKSALGYRYLGFAEFEEKQNAEALADFARAIELDPNNALTRYLRAYLASTQTGTIGNDAQLEEDLRTAIAASPEFSPPYGVLAVFLAAQGQKLPEALALAEKAVTLEPGNMTYRMQLAQVLAQMNRYDEARTVAAFVRSNADDPEEKHQAARFLSVLQQAQSNMGNTLAPPPEDDAADPGPATATAKATADGAATAAKTENVLDAAGRVTELSCMNGLKFKLETKTGPMMFQLNPGAQLVRYSFKTTGTFNPCVDLKGQRVSVEYQPGDATGNVNLLKSVTLLPPAE